MQDFYTLFLEDDAPHSFLTFLQRNGDEAVKVGPWRAVDDSNSDSNTSGYQRSGTVPSTTKFLPGKSFRRTVTFITKIIPSSYDSTTIPIGVTNIQTLSIETSQCILDSWIHFDFEGNKTSLAGLSQFLISNDVKGSKVNVRVVLREGAGNDTGNIQTSSRDAILEGAEQDTTASLFSCFSHPLLMPSDTPCNPISPFKANKKEWTKPMNSFGDIHGEKHALVGASLLSAIQAKNAGRTPKWKVPRKVFNNRFDEMTASQSNIGNQKDVLACSSRGALKLKPVPSFEFVRTPSNSATEGHSASFRRSASVNGFNSNRGLAMNIEMDIHCPSLNKNGSAISPIPSFSRSHSYNNLDMKVYNGLKKRVSRTFISWAESWCMRIWEEEESHRIKFKLNKVDDVTRKRKTNVRPTVRRIGEKGGSPVNRKITTRSESQLSKNVIELDGQRTRLMFVRQTSETFEEEECGVEVICNVNATKVARKRATKDGKSNVLPTEKQKMAALKKHIPSNCRKEI